MIPTRRRVKAYHGITDEGGPIYVCTVCGCGLSGLLLDRRCPGCGSSQEMEAEEILAAQLARLGLPRENFVLYIGPDETYIRKGWHQP